MYLNLSLDGCDIMSAGVMALGQGGCPQLSYLSLRWCCEITDAGVIALGQGGCPQLSYLSLSQCYKITDAGVIALCQGGYPQLSSLHLDECDKITDAAPHPAQMIGRSPAPSLASRAPVRSPIPSSDEVGAARAMR